MHKDTLLQVRVDSAQDTKTNVSSEPPEHKLPEVRVCVYYSVRHLEHTNTGAP